MHPLLAFALLVGGLVLLRGRSSTAGPWEPAGAFIGTNAGTITMPVTVRVTPMDPTGAYPIELNDPLPRGVPLNDPAGTSYCLLNPDDPACNTGPNAGIVRAF